MKFSLFSYPRKILPKSLYGRAFLIIFAPLVFVQIITTYVFLDRHLTSVTHLLAQAISSEICVATEIYQEALLKGKSLESHDLLNIFSRSERKILSTLNLKVQYVPEKQLLKNSKKMLYRYPWADEILLKNLSEKLFFPFVLLSDSENIFVNIELSKGFLEISLPYKRLMSKTTTLVLLGTFGASALFLTIALLFMRNQVRPIQKLAEAAEQLGKGQNVSGFRPQGALEVRKAGHSFLLMKERIQRQITQRTEMLAGISHDLKTPLTRMKLQLALLPESQDTHYLHEDIQEMEFMIKEYLDFVKGEGEEKPILTDVILLVENVIGDIYRTSKKVDIKLDSSIKFPLFLEVRPHALRRCFANLLENAQRYAKHVWVSMEIKQGFLLTHIEDDGPGIPESDYENVFRPFMRLEGSRNLSTGGVGLGLTITRDIARAHGGEVILSKSSYGGLKATLKLPM
ncbi:MAG: two-component sensor histidine kinase [Proteobacteria bacterium]|nr:two-component sensor histidine kinase [Pseudomonadota bacterium]